MVGSNYLWSWLLKLSIACSSYRATLSTYVTPEAVFLVAVMILIALVSNTHDLWQDLCERMSTTTPHASASKLSVASIEISAANNVTVRSAAEDVHEMRRGHIGGYGLKGRRPKMEDRMAVRDDLGELSMHMYGVFDGHGGDVSVRLLLTGVRPVFRVESA